MEFVRVFVVVLTAVSFFGISAGNDDPDLMTVATVEYQPILEPTVNIEDRLNGNIANYIEILSGLSSGVDGSGVDLIVYPESTISFGAVHDVASTYATYAEIGDTPCENTNYMKFMQDISCAAKKYNTYIVINAAEKVRCDKNTTTSKNCQEIGHFLYNSDIIFDSNGAVVQTYHKYNLFGEYDMDRPTEVDNVVFSVKGKDTFGIFTCFDILFKTPAQSLVESGVKNFVFPTMWFGELPFLTALQAQQMWSQTHDVTFYSAGANNPSIGSGGTGIFLGSNGPMESEYLTETKWKPLVRTYAVSSKIIQKPSKLIKDDVDTLAKQMDDFYLKIDDLAGYTSVTLESVLNEAGLAQTELCHSNKLCCKFDIEVSKTKVGKVSNQYEYLLVAFSGARSFSGVYNGGVEVCGLIACLSTDLKTCGQRFSNYDTIAWTKTFKTINIKANFVQDGNRTQYPNSLLSSIRPLSPTETRWTEKIIDDATIERSFTSLVPQDRILTFAIYGRDFNLDSEPETNSAPFVFLSHLLYLIIIVKIFL